jgi:Flp pilus assembly pilin Flp
MLKHYVNIRTALLNNLSTDKRGVMSLEYVIVAAFVVTAVIAGLNTSSVPAALATGFTAITIGMAGL